MITTKFAEQLGNKKYHLVFFREKYYSIHKIYAYT